MSHGMPLLGAPRGKFGEDQHENVIPSLMAAPSWVDAVYINVRLTSDDVPILMHDSTVDRTTDGTGAVNSLTLAEIQALDAGDGAQVPTLEEYLAAVVEREDEADEPVRPLRVIIAASGASDADDVQTIYDVASAWSLYGDRVEWVWGNYLTGDTLERAQDLRALDASTPMGTFIGRVDNIVDMVDAALSVDSQFIFVNPGTTGYSADPSIIDTVRAAGMDGRVSRTSNMAVIETVRDDADVGMLLTFRTNELSTWHDVDDPDPEPPSPAPDPVARPRIRRRVTWLGVDAVSGRVVAELPDVRGEVGRLLSAYESAQLSVPIPLSGPGHVPMRLLEQATQPIRSAIVAVVNDLPVWMGWVLGRRGGTGAEMRLATVTPEGYLTRRRVRDHTFSGVDRAVVAAELIGDAGALDGVGDGLGLELDVELTGDEIDRQYVATDRESVYDALRELAADGLEFTVDLDWDSDDHNVVRKFVRIAQKLGRRESGALFETTASSLFDSQAGSEATYELMEDYSGDRFGNHVTAVAPGEGEDQPASSPVVDQAALDAGAPIVEHVAEVSAADTSQSTLDRLAAAELDRVHRGAEVWDIQVRLSAYPRLGVDAMLGDDVAWLLTGHRHPDGVMGSGRMIGWRVDEQDGVWRPVLLDPQEV